MAEEKSYVYIDAPSLDNADQCKFILNKDFQYVQTGETGNVAELPLYEKFVGNEIGKSMDLEGLGRTVFKNGLVSNKSESTNISGDYLIGNVCQVWINIFKIGTINGFKFRLFNKSEITAANRNSTTPTSYIDNYSSVPRVAIFGPVFENDVLDKNRYQFLDYAEYTETDADGSGIYTVRNKASVAVSGKMLNAIGCCLCFVFLPSGINLNSGHDTNPVTFGNLRNAYVSGDENSPRKVGLRAVPRSGLDNRSYICYNTDTNSGFNCGESRMLDFDYFVNCDLIDEYIGTNSRNHHLDILSVKDLNSLRYNAPLHYTGNLFNKKIGIVKEEGNSKGLIYISHESLSRKNIFDIVNKPISSIKIPFKFSNVNEDYYTNGLKDGEFLTEAGGLCHTSRMLHISLETDQDGNPTNWITSDDYITYSRYDDLYYYEFKFNNTNSELLKYKGRGIWIKAAPPAGEQGRKSLAFEYWDYDNGDKHFWAYSQKDKVYFSGETTPINVTPRISVIFDYAARNEWFNYVEYALLDHTDDSSNFGGFTGGIIPGEGGEPGGGSISGNSLTLGEWRIYVTDDGNLAVQHSESPEPYNVFEKPGYKNTFDETTIV